MVNTDSSGIQMRYSEKSFEKAIRDNFTGTDESSLAEYSGIQGEGN